MELVLAQRRLKVHSMTVLNGYADGQVEFGDERPYVFGNITNLGTQTVSIDQFGTVQLPLGLTDLQTTSAPVTSTFSISLANFMEVEGYAQVPDITYPDKNSFVSISYQPETYTYVAGNVGTDIRYNSVAEPYLTLNSPEAGSNVQIYSTWNDSVGNVFAFSTWVNVIPLFDLTTDYSYSEDTRFDLAHLVVDTKADVSTSRYQLQLKQTYPVPTNNTNTVQFVANLAGQGRTGNYTTSTLTKAQLNALALAVDPPVDYTGTVEFDLTFRKYNDADELQNSFTQKVTCTCTLETAEYTRPVSLEALLKGTISLNQFQVLDGNDPSRTYELHLTIPNTTLGNLVSNSGTGTTITASGTREEVNSIMALAGYRHYAADGDPAGTGGTVNATLNLFRTSPSNVALATNQVTSLTIRTPNPGEYWIRGRYVGLYNATTGSTTSGTTHHLIIRNSSSTPAYDNAESRYVVNFVRPYSSSSITDGLYNTLTFFGGQVGVSGTAFNYAYYYTNPRGEWYLPSITEMQYAMDRAPAQFESSKDYWSSTWDHDLVIAPEANVGYVISIRTAGAETYSYWTWTQASSAANILAVVAMRRIPV